MRKENGRHLSFFFSFNKSHHRYISQSLNIFGLLDYFCYSGPKLFVPTKDIKTSKWLTNIKLKFLACVTKTGVHDDYFQCKQIHIWCSSEYTPQHCSRMVYVGLTQNELHTEKTCHPVEQYVSLMNYPSMH